MVNRPGRGEGADVAIFAGKGKGQGISYVQGERKAIVPAKSMLDALLSECRTFAEEVARGEATLKNAAVDIKPPDPLPRGMAGCA
ncbi:MAG: hypothetical protein IT449_09415 [Phycisphaerales bacterium]|nr:hypothetical protein [Phycisphaerales bacterium]